MRSSASGRTLVIMAKAPTPGRVKTRLTQSLPAEAVTEFYCCLLHDTMALALSLSAVDVAIMCPASDVEDLTWLTEDQGEVSVVAQKGEGLAAGLTFGLCTLHSAEQAKRRCLQQRQPASAGFGS